MLWAGPEAEGLFRWLRVVRADPGADVADAVEVNNSKIRIQCLKIVDTVLMACMLSSACSSTGLLTELVRRYPMGFGVLRFKTAVD